MHHALDRLDRLAEAQQMADALSVALGTGPARITLRRDQTTIVAHVDRFEAAAPRVRYRSVRDVTAEHRERVAATAEWLAETRAARRGQG